MKSFYQLFQLNRGIKKKKKKRYLENRYCLEKVIGIKDSRKTQNVFSENSLVNNPDH